MKRQKRRVAILGTRGVPAEYGGFETLAENLVRYCEESDLPISLAVYCSGAKGERPTFWRDADLRYVPISANGPSSVLYDFVCLFASAWRDDGVILLGVSGAIALPFLRLTSSLKIVTNIDGIEWKRDKWGKYARLFLKISEWCAVRYSHVVISDNQAIYEHVLSTYGKQSELIAYGGDHATKAEGLPVSYLGLPEQYALGLCRIEPENNVEMILEAFSGCQLPLVFVGNWNVSAYGRGLKKKFSKFPSLHLIDAIYEPGKIKSIRDRSILYVHGHSAGGTNPALVEMMHFGKPIAAMDCAFNRNTTEDGAFFFRTVQELRDVVEKNGTGIFSRIGVEMKRIALRKYRWSLIGREYFRVIQSVLGSTYPGNPPAS